HALANPLPRIVEFGLPFRNSGVAVEIQVQQGAFDLSLRSHNLRLPVGSDAIARLYWGVQHALMVGRILGEDCRDQVGILTLPRSYVSLERLARVLPGKASHRARCSPSRLSSESAHRTVSDFPEGSVSPGAPSGPRQRIPTQVR